MVTAQLGITELVEGQSQAELSANAAFTLLDAFCQLSVKDRDLTAPPGSPALGDRYLITAVTPTGLWAGQSGKFAVYQNGWLFVTPKEGMIAWIDDENKMIRYDGSAWINVANERLKSKTISILNPTAASENITVMFADVAKTITRIISVCRGTTPSRTWTLRKSTDRSATGTEVVTGGTTTTNTTTGLLTTSFNSAAIGASNWLWLTTTAGSGTVTELSITVEYLED